MGASLHATPVHLTVKEMPYNHDVIDDNRAIPGRKVEVAKNGSLTGHVSQGQIRTVL